MAHIRGVFNRTQKKSYLIVFFYMIPSFGTIFDVPLLNSKVTSFKYTPEDGVPMKAAIISDCHLGAHAPFLVALNLFVDAINTMIEREEPTVIFILGNLVNGTQSEVELKIVLEFLDTLEVPVYAIGGNHDREYFSKVRWDDESQVVIVKELAIEISAPEKGKPNVNIFLIHDLLNNYRVRDEHAYFYVKWLKEGYPDYIKPEDWLIAGHTHFTLVSPSNKFACVGQFSPEIKSFMYAILTTEGGCRISMNILLKNYAHDVE